MGSNYISRRSGCIRLAAVQTKTKRPRVIYLNGDFLMGVLKAKELRDKNYPSCPYVCHHNGKPFDNLRHGWLAACKRVGLDGRTFHDLRRTGVRNLIRAGVPEIVPMKISGHKTRSVFDRYNVTSEEDPKQAAERLSQYVTVEGLGEMEEGITETQPIEMWAEGGRDLKTQ